MLLLSAVYASQIQQHGLSASDRKIGSHRKEFEIAFIIFSALCINCIKLQFSCLRQLAYARS